MENKYYKVIHGIKKDIIFLPETYSILEVEKNTDISALMSFFGPTLCKSTIDEIPAVKTLELDFCVTDKCNLHCDYCYAMQNELSGGTEMDFSIAKMSVDFFADKYQDADWKIDFIGHGEPLLSIKKVLEIANYIKEKRRSQRCSFFLITNGTLLTKENYELLKKNNISIGISIDGSPQYHDMRRRYKGGHGSFNVIHENLKSINLFSNTQNIWALSVLDDSNDLVDIVENNMKLGFKRVQVKIARITGLKKNSRKKIYLHLCGQYEKYFQQLKDKIIKGDLDTAYAILNETDSIGKILRALLVTEKTFRRCKAGFARFSISPNGEIYPCSSFGSVHGYKVGDVVEKEFNDEMVKEFSLHNVDLDCSDCWCRYLCGGTCKYSSYMEFCNICSKNEYDCLNTKKVCEETIKLVYELSKEAKDQLKILRRFAKLK